MLTDLWLIAQLLLQVCSLFLLAYAVVYAANILRYWQPSIADEKQLLLERKNYLVGVLSQLVLFFQFIGLIFFIFTLNTHLPTLIKGAMCASGVLQANSFGLPLLYEKTGGIFLYIIFLVYQYLDNTEPSYPLTPKKYWWLLPSFVLLVTDFTLQILFYTNIEPNRIVTCCSLDFITGDKNNSLLIGNQDDTKIKIGIWLVVALLLVFQIIQQKSQDITKKQTLKASLQLLTSIAYIILSIDLLKNFFVKYIYGLPSHACLHDLFLSHYNSIGFLLFGAYYALLICIIFTFILKIETKNLAITHQSLYKKLNLIYFMSLIITVFVPLLYWWQWKGEL
jgi:hypothetical protein